MTSISKKTIYFCLTLLLFALPVLVFAQLEVQYPEIPGAPKVGEKTLLPEYIVYFYYFAIAVSGFLALGALLYGGVRYLIAGVNPASKAEARKFISGGALALLIIFLSYLVLTTINPQLAILKLELPRLAPKIADWKITSKPGEAISTYYEIPLGTLIEAVIEKNKVQLLRDFIKEIEKLSKEIKDKTNDLNNELKKCSCGNVSEDLSGCTVSAGCSSGGACFGEPCPNRATIEQERQELQAATQKLKAFLDANLPTLEPYIKAVTNVYYAALFMKEGQNPTPYEQLLELKQLALNYGGKIETISFKGVGGEEIKARGNDPMNFYFDADDETNKETFAELQALEFVIDINLPPLPGVPPPPPRPGALTWPFPGGKLTQPYGCQTEIRYATPCQPRGWLHAGIDIADGPGSNSQIYAAADGEVIGIGQSPGCGYGNWIVIWHESLGLSTAYAHLKSVASGITVGTRVNQSQLIGYEDATGFVFGEHLHFEVLAGKAFTGGNCFGGTKLNPMDYL